MIGRNPKPFLFILLSVLVWNFVWDVTWCDVPAGALLWCLMKICCGICCLCCWNGNNGGNGFWSEVFIISCYCIRGKDFLLGNRGGGVRITYLSIWALSTVFQWSRGLSSSHESIVIFSVKASASAYWGLFFTGTIWKGWQPCVAKPCTALC